MLLDLVYFHIGRLFALKYQWISKILLFDNATKTTLLGLAILVVTHFQSLSARSRCCCIVLTHRSSAMLQNTLRIFKHPTWALAANTEYYKVAIPTLNLSKSVKPFKAAIIGQNILHYYY